MFVLKIQYVNLATPWLFIRKLQCCFRNQY